MNALKTTLAASLAAALAAGCGSSPQEVEEPEPAEPVADPTFEEPDEDPHAGDLDGEPLTATAVMEARSGSDVEGEITLTEVDEGVHLAGEITGLEPGMRGFHVHEYGDCSADDAMSAGDHFNPKDAPHGGPHDDEHHVGDLGNVEVDEDGVAQIDETFEFLTLIEGEQNSIAGRALVVHAEQDDLESQPAGDAGARVGCGVIELD